MKIVFTLNDGQLVVSTTGDSKTISLKVGRRILLVNPDELERAVKVCRTDRVVR